MLGVVHLNRALILFFFFFSFMTTVIETGYILNVKRIIQVPYNGVNKKYKERTHLLICNLLVTCKDNCGKQEISN